MDKIISVDVTLTQDSIHEDSDSVPTDKNSQTSHFSQ